MGMFDYITYGGEKYQTKDTPDQFMSDYEIRGDELWYRKVESEWVEDGNSLFGGYLDEISSEWIFLKDFDGAIQFCREDEENGGYKANKWKEYKALFMNGRMLKIVKIEE